ncbi:Branched-chain amino acid transport ATP-binding protein LivG (TC 3.A.1.4.1) [Alloalcanivorax xenomutans]|uniref:ABC transporter ATP-binding protein n=1 Tax=Alloalcanivorax xenomutans TaxID=1094342 RepID=UPI0006D5C268|nr:ABC transporter ATP-binding protein [Alloalcanivorax xenomutans]PHS64640.1 MAG: ABC transporter ATP-binding protein [Alcanivorax sp.]CUR46429.1 Branched-chain amino acid transport ATP-binding protein LivG (TC 3.A.1.4.1) [Alloalcanivorax xenomutans]
MDILKVDRVCKSYGALEVLKQVSLAVSQGSIFAIIGPNGAGKTTLFKVMTGESPANSGSVWFHGEDITSTPAHRRARAGIGRTFQVARVFNDFSVRENVIAAVEARLRNHRQSLGRWWAIKPDSAVVSEAEALIDEIGLGGSEEVAARFLSHGDRKRLEFVIALALQPRLLMLDEPTAGMSPADRLGIAELIVRIRDRLGVTVVMTEHDMDIVFRLADRVLVLNYGEVVVAGTVEEIRDNPAVQEVYLGKEVLHA